MGTKLIDLTIWICSVIWFATEFFQFVIRFVFQTCDQICKNIIQIFRDLTIGYVKILPYFTIFVRNYFKICDNTQVLWGPHTTRRHEGENVCWVSSHWFQRTIFAPVHWLHSSSISFSICNDEENKECLSSLLYYTAHSPRQSVCTLHQRMFSSRRCWKSWNWLGCPFPRPGGACRASRKAFWKPAMPIWQVPDK